MKEARMDRRARGRLSGAAALLVAPALLVAVMACAVGCEEAIDKGGQGEGHGVITGSITYPGAATASRIGFALFDRPDYPPVTPPVMAVYVPEEPAAGGVSYPMTYRLDAVPTGRYYLMAYGDVDPDDGPFPKSSDPASEWMGPVDITSDGQIISMDLDLADDRWGGQPPADVEVPGGDTRDVVEPEDTGSAEDVPPLDAPTPEPGRAALYGFLNYDGGEEGVKLAVVGFDAPNLGLTAMPKFMKAMDDPSFPHAYEHLDIEPGTYYVYAYLHLDPNGIPIIAEEDPRSPGEVEVHLEADAATRLDLLLQDR